jgi:hypothetical protein
MVQNIVRICDREAGAQNYPLEYRAIRLNTCDSFQVMRYPEVIKSDHLSLRRRAIVGAATGALIPEQRLRRL